MPASKSSKSERTRALIVDTAIELFRKNGYEETTMRQIAEKAGLALGSAYYYFASKEHLVQALYERMQSQQEKAFESVFENATTFKEILLGVLMTELRVIEPYHKIALALFRSGADPESPLSPFSKESAATREKSIEVFRAVLEGSSERFPEDLKNELPYLLWLYQMGIVLFWIHDKSFCRTRSQKLILHSVDLICSIISLASMPIMLPLRQKVLKLLADIRSDNPFSEATA